MMRAAIASLALATGTAWAEPARLDPARKDEATKLVVAGSARFDAKDYAGALDDYEAAYRIYPTPKLHYNRALALAALHRDPEAADEYDRFLADARDAPADARAHATTALGELERAIGTLAIKSNVPGDATVDARAPGATPLSLHLAPGSHTIHVTAPGKKPYDTTIAIAAAEHAHVAVELAPIDLSLPRPEPVAGEVPAPIRPVHDEEPHRSILGRWWFWGAIGVVVGGVAITYAATRASSPPATELGTFMPKL